jgi:plastocyanin
MKHWATWSLAAVGLAVAAWTLPGHAAPPAARAALTAEVDIEHFAFMPARVEVPVGATVTWRNEDEEPHTVTSTAGAFASKGLDYEGTFRQRFTKPGTYQYFCALHPRMTGTVVVKGQ